MKYFGLIFLLFIVSTSPLFSQEKYITHQISQGETISSIAEKYQVSQKVIFDLNPKASGVLKLKSELKIPNKNFKKEIAKQDAVSKTKRTKTLEHIVLPKETLFGIAKKYNLSVDEIKSGNPSIAQEGLKTGNKLKLILPENFVLKTEVVDVQKSNEKTNGISEIPVSNSEIATTVIPVSDNSMALQSHQVVASETKFGISKRYGLTVAELEKLNPTIVNKKLDIGQSINVPLQEKKTSLSQNNEVAVASSSAIPVKAMDSNLLKNEIASSEKSTLEIKENKAIVHEVLPKETKFGIAKKYGITVAELEKRNPSIQQTLKTGALLKIDGVVSLTPNAVASEISKSEAAPTTEGYAKKYFGDFAVADNLIEKASDNLGVRYRSGGTTSAGFDCSGLMFTTFDAFDIKLPRSSIEQANIGLKVDPLEAKKGDLIFFKTRGSGRINHVGMVVEVEGDEIKFIHSSTSNGVIISSTKENYYHRNFAQVNRVLK